MFKRLLDIIISLTGIIILFPLYLILVIMIRKKMGSPAIFTQERAGLNGKPFLLFKFRTMTNEKDSNGNLLPDDKRLTPFGIKLRDLSLDEIPQLLNVLKGDMSLVGPRPLHLRYTPLYNETQKLRLNVKPGITGWAQVHGRNAISWHEKFDLDVWYVQHHNLWLDFKILLLTVKKVFVHDDITFEGEATTHEFNGNN